MEVGGQNGLAGGGAPPRAPDGHEQDGKEERRALEARLAELEKRAEEAEALAADEAAARAAVEQGYLKATREVKRLPSSSSSCSLAEEIRPSK